MNALVGQTTGALWSMINSLQIFDFLPIITLYYPKTMMTMFSYLKIANMKNELLQEVYLLHIDESAIDDRESWDYRFRNQGIESTNILINLADVFFLIIILVLVNALTIGLS